MASTITAGNATNGLAMSSDSTGILNIKTGTGTGTTAMTIDASQAVTIPQTLAVTGAQTIGGNLTVTGNVSGAIKSATAVASTSGTSIDFTGIPSTAKRITVMFNGVSTNGTSNVQIQLGTGATPTYTTSGYLGSSAGGGNGSTIVAANFTAGFGLVSAIGATSVMHGAMTITNINGNNWVEFGVISLSSGTNAYMNGGSVSLAAALTAVRITTVNGTDAFDAGTINILFE